MNLKQSLPGLYLAFLLSGCGGADNPEQSQIYIDNGARQCEFSGNTPEQTAAILVENNIEVLSSGCGYITGVDIISVCGAGDLNINLHTIKSSDVAAATELGFASVSELALDVEQGFASRPCTSE